MSKKLAIEILNDYPLATETVRDWFLKKMIESFDKDSVPEDFKKGMLGKGIPDQTLALMLDESPRNFFDVLDSNNIIIEYSTWVKTYFVSRSIMLMMRNGMKEGFHVKELLLLKHSRN